MRKQTHSLTVDELLTAKDNGYDVRYAYALVNKVYNGEPEYIAVCLDITDVDLDKVRVGEGRDTKYKCELFGTEKFIFINDTNFFNLIEITAEEI